MSTAKFSQKCRPACGGIVTGRPVIVHGIEDLDAVMANTVLVALETDISYVPAMHRAAAIITERGGRYCHAAVWARENNKPTVLQATNATVLLNGVELVTVDADHGTILWEA
jgi:pyruvate,water dikinase